MRVRRRLICFALIKSRLSIEQIGTFVDCILLYFQFIACICGCVYFYLRYNSCLWFEIIAGKKKDKRILSSLDKKLNREFSFAYAGFYFSFKNLTTKKSH